jgi:hypothetical protein
MKERLTTINKNAKRLVAVSIGSVLLAGLASFGLEAVHNRHGKNNASYMGCVSGEDRFKRLGAAIKRIYDTVPSPELDRYTPDFREKEPLIQPVIRTKDGVAILEAITAGFKPDGSLDFTTLTAIHLLAPQPNKKDQVILNVTRNEAGQLEYEWDHNLGSPAASFTDGVHVARGSVYATAGFQQVGKALSHDPSVACDAQWVILDEITAVTQLRPNQPVPLLRKPAV